MCTSANVTRTLLLLVAGLAPGAAKACPDCQYEFCVVTACWCQPKDQCILPPAIKDIGKALEEAPRLVASTIQQAVTDIAATVKKAFDDTTSTLDIAIKDGVANVEKAGNDVNAEAGRFGRELGNTVHAIEHAAQNDLEGTVDSIRSAERRIREGKVVDAVWHAALSPVQVADHSASEAVLESSYLRGIGQIAASAYGGPAGAAAYSAWLAYHQTGDPSLALRVGILAGASAGAFGAAGQITDTAKRAIVTAAIGGLGVAAAGGNEQAVKEAFLLAGAMVVVQDGYQAYTKHGLDPQASVGSEAYCISAVATNCVPLPDGAVVGLDEKGNFLVDMSKVDPAVPAVGLKDNTAYFNESNPAMVAVSKVPGMQAMAIFHDTWTVDWKSDLMVKASILPAIVLTYVGTTAPFFDKLETTAVERSLNGSLGKTEPVGHANPNAITVNPLRVVDSAVSFPEKKGYTVIALERRNAKPWCSGQEEGLLKTHTKLGDFYRCLRKENGGQITAKGPNINTDYACRVLTTASGLTELREASLFDPDACELPFENRLLSVPVGGAGRWYRADARAAPTMTAAK